MHDMLGGLCCPDEAVVSWRLVLGEDKQQDSVRHVLGQGWLPVASVARGGRAHGGGGQGSQPARLPLLPSRGTTVPRVHGLVEPGPEQAGDLKDFPGGLGGKRAASHGAQEKLVGAGPVAPAPPSLAVVDVQGDVAGWGEAGQVDTELGQADLLAAGEGGHVEGDRPAGAVLQGA